MELRKEKFVYYITERESIRLIKEGGLEAPWSADPVFQTTYFCNNDREHDKVTRCVRGRFDLLGENTATEANMVMARMVNKIESLEALGWPWNWWHQDLWDKVMSQSGSWGSAYIVSTNGAATPKHKYIGGLLKAVFEQFNPLTAPALPTNLKDAHKALQGVRGLGSFMAAQVLADLKNTKGHPLASAEDWSTFAAPGPGSLRGLSWFHTEKITPSTFTEALQSARQWVYNNKHTGLIEHLCNQNLQNCFCEYDKYMRVDSGQGRTKRKYNGR